MIPGGQCAVNGCGKRAHSKGWCLKHYTRARRHGDPLTVLKRQTPAPADGVCTIEGCAVAATARGWCQCHYTRWLRHGDPLTRLNGDGTSYTAVHARLKSRRGPARDHVCVDCGRAADQWSYDHQDPDELWDSGLTYSADLSRYQPRCTSCHVRLDQRDRARGEDGRFLPKVAS